MTYTYKKILCLIVWKFYFTKIFKKATNGGLADASTVIVQVGSLMWLRTTMNYQYRYGQITESLKNYITKVEYLDFIEDLDQL